MKLKELIGQLETLSPPKFACSWDNVGLLVGRKEQEIKKVLVTLDVTKDVIKEAVNQKVDLVISHHPMIFSALKQVNDHTILGDKILELAENRIGCYSMHTNFDVKGGMAELAEQRLQLKDAIPLEIVSEEDGMAEGIGRIGTLPYEMTLKECGEYVKKQFELSQIARFGDENKRVKKVAICSGSGKGMWQLAMKNGADVLITGDIGHHEGVDGVEAGFAFLDGGHHGLEKVFIPFMAKYLKENIPQLEVIEFDSQCPFIWE